MPLLAFVSLVPLGLALHNASRTKSFLCAYACGFLGWTMLTPGLTAGFSSYTHVSLVRASVLVIVSCGLLAVPYGIFGFLYGKFRWMKGQGGALKTAACLTLLVTFAPSPLPLDSSHSLYGFPPLLQLMDLGGQPLVLFILYLFNWVLIDIALNLRERRSCKAGLAWILVITVLMMGYGYFRLAGYHREESEPAPARRLKIAIIQPNIPVASESLHSLDGLQTLMNQSSEVIFQDKSIDLIIWPEISTRISCEPGSQTNQQLIEAAARYGVPLLINCTQLAPDGRDYNTALFIAVNGSTRAYRKQILFPFTEYLPGEQLFPEGRTLVPGVSRYAAGTEATVFPIKDSLGLFTAICYEVLFPNHSQKFLERGGNILISPSNDAWFGANRIPDFEVASAVFQAIQYRIPVVRVSNSGSSLAVKASGEVPPNSRTPSFTRTTSLVEVYAPRERSFYSRFGNLFLYVLALGWVLGVISDLLKRRKSTSADVVVH
jgi:apolipoprotein N-acyltransferase